MKQRLTVGILNFHKHVYQVQPLLEAVKSLGHVPVVVPSNQQHDISYALHYIETSSIRHWIGSGSEWNVDQSDSPKLDDSLLRMRNKKFFLICYSMQSFLHHVCGCSIQRMPQIVQKIEMVHSIPLWRNHNYAFFKAELDRQKKYSLQNIQTFQDKFVMSLSCGNVWMTQYHPERTEYGVRVILSSFLDQ